MKKTLLLVTLGSGICFGYLAFSQESLCYPVKLDSYEITCFKNGIGSFTAENRSHLVEQKIKKLADDYSFDPDTISISLVDGYHLISAVDFPIMSINTKDLDGMSDLKLSNYIEEISKNLKKSIFEYRKNRTPEVIITGFIYSFLLTISFFLIIHFFIKTLKYVKKNLFNFSNLHIEKLQIKSYKFVSHYRINQTIDGIMSIFKTIGLLFILYFYFSILLSFFPWTSKYSSQIIDIVANPFKKVLNVTFGYFPNIFYILAIFTITHYFLKIIRLFFDEIERGELHFSSFHQEWARPTFSLVQFLFYALAMIMAFPYLPGSSSPAFQGMSVFFGVLVSFGSGSAIANIISGIVITYMRPFKIGDRVKIADTVGDIMEKNFLITRVKTIKNIDVTIPNSMVLGSHIVNYSSNSNQEGLILNTSVTIGYDTPWKIVHELLKKAAFRTEWVDKDQTPFILQTALNDFHVSYELNVYTEHASKMANIYSELHQNIQDVFNEKGLEIMSPRYFALRDGKGKNSFLKNPDASLYSVDQLGMTD